MELDPALGALLRSSRKMSKSIGNLSNSNRNNKVNKVQTNLDDFVVQIVDDRTHNVRHDFLEDAFDA